MFAITEITLPPLPPSLRAELERGGKPVLRRVDLAVLQTLIAANRLDPSCFLTPAEQATLASFTFPKRRLEWLGGRLAAKATALAREGQDITTAALATWQVNSAPDGRPGLQKVPASPGRPAWELSISHSHGLAAALVVAGRSCGLDLQKITATVVRVREWFCSDAEAALMRSALVGPDEVRLTQLWAAKEAVRKGRGGVPLTGFLAMRLAGIEKLAEQAWCLRLAVAGAAEYPVVVFLVEDFVWAVSVR